MLRLVGVSNFIVELLPATIRAKRDVRIKQKMLLVERPSQTHI